MADNNNNAPPGGADQETLKRFAKLLELQEGSVKDAQKLLEIYKKVDDSLASRLTVTQQEMEVVRRQQSLNERMLKDAKLLTAEAASQKISVEELTKELLRQGPINDKKTAALKLQLKYQRMFTSSAQESVDASEDLAKSLTSAVTVYKGGFDVAILNKVQKAFQGGATSLKAFAGGAAMGLLGSFISQIVNLAVSLHDAESGFRKATGAGAGMARQVTNTYEATRAYGVSIEEASQAHQALFKNMTDFTMSTRAEQAALAETGAVMTKYGVSAESFAKSIQNSTKMFGQSATQAEATTRELVTFAQELGVAPDMLMDKFAGMGSSLAKFGTDGVKAFKDLSHISKITGMEMEKVLRITNAFDTFEGAAEQAGQLNAALGGNFVNAMDLMMATDPAERFGMIRDSILDAGLTFEDMSYYQKQFYVESLGLDDVGDLAMMLSGNMDNLGGATNKSAKELIEMKEQAFAMQSFQEKLNATFASLIPILEPMIDGISRLAFWMKDNIGLMKVLGGVLLTIGVAMTVFGIATNIAALPLWGIVAAVLAIIGVMTALYHIMFKKDVGASTFLEGLGKIGHGFEDIGTQSKLATKSVKTLGTQFDRNAATNAAARSVTANAGAGRGGATQTVRQPIRFEMGGKKMWEDLVIEVIAAEIQAINLT